MYAVLTRGISKTQSDVVYRFFFSEGQIFRRIVAGEKRIISVPAGQKVVFPCHCQLIPL